MANQIRVGKITVMNKNKVDLGPLCENLLSNICINSLGYKGTNIYKISGMLKH